jgi:methyl-accepting chemotaxis protein PixJ
MAQTPPSKNRQILKNRQIEAPSESLDTLQHQSPNPNSFSTQSRQKSFLQKLFQPWENLGFRNKLTLILLVGISVALLTTTQITVGLIQQQAIANIDVSLKTDLSLLKEEIALSQTDMEDGATALSKLVAVANLNVSNAAQIPTQLDKIEAVLSEAVSIHPNASLYVIVDNQGKTIAQRIQIGSRNFSQYPPLPAETTIEVTNYQPVSPLEKFSFREVPIVINALNLKEPLKGVELFSGRAMQQLGLGRQAAIGIRQQKIANLPELQQPFPEGTFDVDDGKAGLMLMAAVPIQINGELVGATVLGTLINNNFELVDRLKQKTGVQVATIFAQDWRVSTNVPYSDLKTRAVGTRVSREVADVVLTQEETFLGEANIIGDKYRTAYSPLYDHRKAIEPSAKPIGIAFVGQSQQLVQKNLNAFALTSYGVGGGVLLVSGFIVALVANSFSNALNRLADFAQKVGMGARGIRLKATDRRDEIGILTQRMNQMVNDLEFNEDQSRQETEQERLNFLSEITASDVRDVQGLDPVFNGALEFIREHLKADRIVIYRFTPEWRGVVTVESVAPSWMSALNWNAQDPCIPQKLLAAYRRGRVVSTPDVFKANFHPSHLRLMKDLEIKANLVVPILVEDRLFALLIAHQCSAPRIWQEFDITFLKQAAAQLGLAIGRVTFLEQMRNMASEQRHHKELLQEHAFQLLQDVEAVSQGNLTVEVAVTEDEIGTIADFYNSTIESLRKIVLKVKTASQEVIETTVLNQFAVESLVEEVTQQSTEISQALEQIAVMNDAVRTFSTMAEKTELLMQEANQTVRKGDMAMDQTVTGIQMIHTTVLEAEKKVRYLGESAQKVSKIVDLISTFANQTHMLALSASLEASRAGEPGKGFAVIANEVRVLADQSAEATREIKQVVAAIQTETSGVSTAIGSGLEQILRGTHLLSMTQQNLKEITLVSNQASQLVEGLAQATIIQSQTSETVAQTMMNVTNLTHKTSHDANQVSRSFQQLRKVAKMLQQEVERFKVS